MRYRMAVLLGLSALVDFQRCVSSDGEVLAASPAGWTSGSTRHLRSGDHHAGGADRGTPLVLTKEQALKMETAARRATRTRRRAPGRQPVGATQRRRWIARRCWQRWRVQLRLARSRFGIYDGGRRKASFIAGRSGGRPGSSHDRRGPEADAGVQCPSDFGRAGKQRSWA